MVRTNSGSSGGFIDDTRRINVALTRARHGLVIVGDAATLSKNSKDWKILLREMKDHVVQGLEGAIERLNLYLA